jgi:hypothetical protein
MVDYVSSGGTIMTDYFDEPESVKYTNDYVKRLIIEFHYIYARLLNPGASIILRGTAASTEQGEQYSTEIGSSFHLDLIELQRELRKLPANERKALITWALGLSSQQASVFLGARGAVRIRKRQERGKKALVKGLNEPRDGGTLARG